MNRFRALFSLALLLSVTAVGLATSPQRQNQRRNQMNSNAPTVILVHGAFADASSWAGVIERLQLAGAKVLAPSNPLRGLTLDGEYIASVARQVNGPVLLVGHSYGGPVITYAGSKAENVKGLVFVASFGVDRGQSATDSTAAFPAPLLASSVEPHQYPDSSAANGQGVELYVQKDKFAEVFAADVAADKRAVLAVSQRPVSVTGLGEPLSLEPAWKRLPSWFLVTTRDNAINPDAQRAAAKRMGAITKEVTASHAVMLSQPGTVTNFILDAVNATTKN
jgi:pimeloyl-ACP methyl ester carboxylesterase